MPLRLLRAFKITAPQFIMTGYPAASGNIRVAPTRILFSALKRNSRARTIADHTPRRCAKLLGGVLDARTTVRSAQERRGNGDVELRSRDQRACNQEDLIAVCTEGEAVGAPADQAARIAIHTRNIHRSSWSKAIDIKCVDSPCCIGGRRILGEIEDPSERCVRLYQARYIKRVYNGQARHLENLTRGRENPLSTR